MITMTATATLQAFDPHRLVRNNSFQTYILDPTLLRMSLPVDHVDIVDVSLELPSVKQWRGGVLGENNTSNTRPTRRGKVLVSVAKLTHLKF